MKNATNDVKIIAARMMNKSVLVKGFRISFITADVPERAFPIE